MNNIYDHIQTAIDEAKKNLIDANTIIINKDVAILNDLYSPNKPLMILGLKEYDNLNLYGINFAVCELHSRLSDDEKVILKNVGKKYKYISRNQNGELYLYPSAIRFPYDHLFQFIKTDNFLISDLLQEEI